MAKSHNFFLLLKFMSNLSSKPDVDKSSSVLSEQTLLKVIPADLVSLAKTSLKIMPESTSALMTRAELLKFVESEEFEIRSQEITRKRSMRYKCKYCGAASYTSEKELHDHVFYCSIGVPWSEYYPHSYVKKRVKKTTWS